MRRLLFILSAVASVALCLASVRHLVPLALTEVLGFITGGYCVWLTVEENVWNWPIGIANSAFFLALFLHTRLFADAALQLVYIVLGFLGWYWWLRGGPAKTVLHVRRIGMREASVLVLIAVSVTTGMTRFLGSVHDAAPFWDAFTTVLSLIAQYLLTRKVLENWPVWITADVIYVWLYAYKHLYLTSGLYIVFLALCIGGLVRWARTLRVSPNAANLEGSMGRVG